MASVIAALFSRSRPPPPAGLHTTTPSVGQTSGATPRCLNPGFSERIGNSRRTGDPDAVIAAVRDALAAAGIDPGDFLEAVRPAADDDDELLITCRAWVHVEGGGRASAQ